MSKIREEFEGFIAYHKWSNAALEINGKFSRYMDPDIDNMWIGWCARQKTLRVNLPSRVLLELSTEDEVTGLNDMDGYYEPNEIHKALDAAGIRYE